MFYRNIVRILISNGVIISMTTMRVITCTLLLIIAIAFSPLSMLPTVKGTGERYASVLYSTDWLMQDYELILINQAFSQIHNLYAEQGVWVLTWVWNEDYQEWFPVWTRHPMYDHLHNFRGMTTRTLVANQIIDIEANHPWGTVFYYGHMNVRNVGAPWPDYSYGFASQASQHAQTPPPTIWDSDHIFPYTINKHRFVFLWVCNNANCAGNSNPVPHGMPYCWTRQANLSPNGYANPDSRPYAFIGFQNFSVTLQEGMGTTGQYGQENIYKHWLVFFYYWALNGKTINQALHEASKNVGYTGGWNDPLNRLSQGWHYTFSGGPGGNPPAGPYWGKMRIYGNGAIYIPQEW